MQATNFGFLRISLKLCRKKKRQKNKTVEKKIYADKGIAPKYPGHEPDMLLLH